MARFKYLYLDDESDETTAAITDGLKIKDIINVVAEEPKEFKTEIANLKSRLKDFDGLILDLRLDGRRLDIAYNAPSLAQELRMIAAENGIKSVPIVLCSTDEKMRATYEVEKICYEHFDYKFTKHVSPPWEKFATKLAALANGYKYIQEVKFVIPKILNRSDLDSLDPRVLETFNSIDKPLPVYHYASFVVKELFHHPGVLIKEKLLAARLGIDISKSSDWNELLTIFFIPAAYTGVFSDGWNRWWSDMVINLFIELSKGKRLSMLSAEERVKTLIEITGLKNLVAAVPMEYNKSTNFWTICESYKTPLDPLEGFKIHSTIEPKPWQEDRYISLLEVLTKKSKIKPHSSELNRIHGILEEVQKK
jgi:hypothetical protein